VILSWVRFEYIGLVVGAGLTWAGIRVLRRTRDFERIAWRASGVVTEVRWLWREGTNRRYAYPVVRFPLPDGRVVHTESDVGSSPSPVSAGDRVDVLYDPVDPTRARVASTTITSTILSVMLIFIGGGFLLVCALWTALDIWLSLR
jgi:Protein of unknown function (DUF3592)